MQRELIFSFKQIVKAHLILGGGLGGFYLYLKGLDFYIWFKRNELMADYARLRENEQAIRQMRENQRQVLMEQSQAQLKLIEQKSNITGMRKNYMREHVRGDVLQGCVGQGKNYQFYRPDRVSSVVAVDWQQDIVEQNQQRLLRTQQFTVKYVLGDVHNLGGFKENSFDTVVDTFGLECCYDVEKALLEYWRVLKVGGRLVLIERGESTWKTQNFRILRAASARITSRGEVLHQNYEEMARRVLGEKVRIIEKERQAFGMVQGLVFEKLL